MQQPETRNAWRQWSEDPGVWRTHVTPFAHQLLEVALGYGMDQAEVAIHQGVGDAVTVRDGALEAYEGQQDQQVVMTVYADQKQASASLGGADHAAVLAALKATCEAVHCMQSDPCLGLADASCMATDFPDLDLFHPWQCEQQTLIDMGCALEARALAASPLLDHSEGVDINRYTSYSCYANTHGFVGTRFATRQSMDCALVAKRGDERQRDADYTVARDANDLTPVAALADEVAKKTLRRLGARPLSTRRCPVLFSQQMARQLIGYAMSAISGGALYREQSFLLNRLDESILPSWMDLYEDPYIVKGLGSAAFDAEGVQTRRQHFVQSGVLKQYLLGSYAARRLGLVTTGNAGGLHHLAVMAEHPYSFEDLLSQMGTGLYVTEMMGSGVDITTGHISQGVFGYWVEHGEIQHPVEGVTIAGNLLDLYQKIQAVGDDVDHRGKICVGSFLIDEITVGGV